jgi:hypothetical protein
MSVTKITPVTAIIYCQKQRRTFLFTWIYWIRRAVKRHSRYNTEQYTADTALKSTQQIQYWTVHKIYQTQSNDNKIQGWVNHKCKKSKLHVLLVLFWRTLLSITALEYIFTHWRLLYTGAELLWLAD